jgi:release factor family 10
MHDAHATDRMTLTERIASLSVLTDSDGPVVSVYLSTRWTDQQQRERIRVFLKTELRRARQARPAEGLAEALDWIEAEGAAIIGQSAHLDCPGVALFACPGLGLREVISLPTPVENTFLVSARPFLPPLATAADQLPPTVVVFVDTESARLIPVLDATAGEEIRLESDVPGHHRRGGWAQLALGHYQRHIAERRGRHLEAVSDVLARMVAEHDVQRIVIAGHGDSTAAFERALPSTVAARVAGVLPASRNEPASELVARAADLIANVATRETAASLDAILTEAAKGGSAAASLESVLEALQRGAVDHLYLLHEFRERGRACPECGGLQPGDTATCRVCRSAAVAVELGETMVSRATAAGGAVTMVDAHARLAAVGGVAARLRFAL